MQYTTHLSSSGQVRLECDYCDNGSKKNDLNRKRSWLGVTTQLPSQLETALDASDLSVTNVTMISKSWKKQLPLPYDINPNCSWRLTPAVNVAPNVTFNASDCLRDAFKKHTGPGQHPCLQKGSHSFIYAKYNMTQSQLVWSFESQSRVKVKVVKWCRKKWFDHNQMYIYHKQCEILQKNHRNSSNIQFQWFPIEKGRKLCKRKRWNGWSKSIF